jgi:hypothetical protein
LAAFSLAAGVAPASAAAATCDANTCTIEGTSGNDPDLDGTSGGDVICGLGGNDTVTAVQGNPPTP